MKIIRMKTGPQVHFIGTHGSWKAILAANGAQVLEHRSECWTLYIAKQASYRDDIFSDRENL